jgi:hypothetical protein
VRQGIEARTQEDPLFIGVRMRQRLAREEDVTVRHALLGGLAPFTDPQLAERASWPSTTGCA